VAKDRVAVLLLSDITDAEAQLEALPREVEPPLDVTQVRTALDFPGVALQLAGLDAVILDHFDTATLSDRQRRAIQDYVSLGGSLVLTGGETWRSTLRSLPEGLVPLAASGSAKVSLQPLADLLAGSTTAIGEVATGKNATGRVSVGGPGGPPLVVESAYHAGKVIQLTYDPLAGPIASDRALQHVAWDQALRRVENRWGHLLPESSFRTAPEDQLWASALAAPTWPSLPRWKAAMVGMYCLLIAPAGLVLSRRFRPGLGWLVVSFAAATTAGAVFVGESPRSTASKTVVEMQAQGADGTVMTTTYRGVLDFNPADVVMVPGAAASTVFSGRPVFRPVRGVLDPLMPLLGQEPRVIRGRGGGTVLAAPRAPRARRRTRRWELHTVQTLSVDLGGPRLEASLRLAGVSGNRPARLQGTVTNRGPRPIRQLRAQIREGQALLPDELKPGETLHVDASIDPVTDMVPHEGKPGATPEEVAMFAAGSRSFTGPAQVAVTGVTSPSAKSGGASVDPAGRKISVVVAVIPLEGSDTIPYGSGGGLRVAASTELGEEFVAVQDLTAPPGAGPLSIRYAAGPDISPGQPPDPFGFTVETYNWTTGTWRPLSRSAPRVSSDGTPLTAAEVNNGLVRFRTRSHDPRGTCDGELVLTPGPSGPAS